MISHNNEVITLNNGDISLWIVNDTSLHIKCVTNHGDPVELNVEEIKELCEILTSLAHQLN